MDYSAYLSFLDDLLGQLLELTQVEKNKKSAVESHSLGTLNECIKQEQAISLALRGLEQRRKTILAQLGLQGYKMQEMPQNCPPEHAQQTKLMVEKIAQANADFTTAKKEAASIINRNLKIVETSLRQRGVVLDEEQEFDMPPMPKKPNADFKA